MTSPTEDLSTFFDVSIDMLCIRDMHGRFLKVSRSWETVLGYTVEELQGAPLLPLIHPDDVAATRGQMARINLEEEIVGFINRYRHRDGRYRYLEWRARRAGDRVFAVARDVTDRLAIEAQMQAAKQAAEAANQTKTDFLANMSHEIRTPLNGVMGVVSALARTPLTPEQREMVDLIETAGVTLERLVSDILDVSKIEAGLLKIETRAFDLREDIQALAATFQIHAVAKGLSFHATYGEGLRGPFVGDSTRIMQVLANLLSNAVKFTSQGHIHVRIDVTDPQESGQPSQVSLEVEDSGVGFDSAVAADLFSRFSQADTSITRRFGGTGLGLSICKSIVEMMGGEITVRSEAGSGSLFRAVIPMPRGASTPEAERPASAPAGVNRAFGLRVLLAEDHPVNQRVVQLILAPLGARITTVPNGAEATEAFKAEPFDLVLMDMQMPVMDGLAATQALRRHEASLPARPRTPIVMLSANAMPHHLRDAMTAGADLYLAKPLTAAALVKAVNDILGAAADAALVNPAPPEGQSEADGTDG
ncbi:MAG: multi-sensor hybrid histidine kinase [Caulobacteraceae bacterium]|nr:multi-sensor hybrid histidine kinase [Caulobacteraceae bacterium]